MKKTERNYTKCKKCGVKFTSKDDRIKITLVRHFSFGSTIIANYHIKCYPKVIVLG